MPDENSEQVLTNFRGENKEEFYYDLRKQIRKPEWFGEINEDNPDEDDTDSDTDATEMTNQTQATEAQTNSKTDDQIQIDKLTQSTDIPEYMTTPQWWLFENTNPENAKVKHFPKRLDLNHFLNYIYSKVAVVSIKNL